MPDKPDKDFNMIIGSEFQDAGIKDAEKGSQQVAAATQQAAATSEQAAQKSSAATQQAAASTEQAAQKSAAASEKEAERQKQLAEMMRLTMMTRKELRAEILRLVDAQKSAAAQNNSKAYEELTTSINRAKEALEKLNTAQQVGMIAMQQQAQTGMQFAQGLGSMKEAASQGAAGLATMATQALALGMAIKAGLGPIGWVMAALQGLGMIVTYFSDKSMKEAEAIKASTKALEEHKKALDDLATAHEKNAASQVLAEADDKVAAIRQGAKMELDALEQKHASAARERERDLMHKRSVAEMTRNEDAKAVQDGLLDPAVAAAREQMRNDEVAAAEKGAQLAGKAEEKERLLAELALAPKLKQAREKTLHDLSSGLSNEDLAVLSIQDKALQQLAQRMDETKAKEQEAERQIDQLVKAKDDSDAGKAALQAATDLAYELHGQRTALEAELVARTKEQVAVLERAGRLDSETADAKAKEALAVVAGLNAARQALADQEDEHNAQQQKLAELDLQIDALSRERGLAEAAAQHEQQEEAAAQQASALAEQWAAKQKETTPKRIKWLQETLDKLKKNSQIWTTYNNQLQQETETLHDQQWADLQKQGRAAQKAWLKNLIKELPEDSQEHAKYTKALKDLAAAAQQEKWQRIQQRGTLAQQQKFLQKILANTKEGSAEAERWNQEMHNVTESIAAKELSEMNETFKVSGQYAVEDKRTQYKILHADRAQLEARAKRLREMFGEEHDAGLREQITKALKENLEQQKGLAQATLANTQAARASLKAYQPPEFHHKNKIIEGNLNRLGKAYAKHVRLEEKYAEQGNFKQAARQDRMRRSIGERITKINKDFAGQVKKDTDDLKASSKKETAEAKKRLRHQQKQNQDLLKDSKQKKKKPQDDQQKPRQKTQEQELQQTKAALEQSKQTLQNTQKALDDMQTKVAETLALCSRITAAAESISKAAGRSLKSLKTRTATLESEVKRLWQEVDA